jgi:hypothetical protein
MIKRKYSGQIKNVVGDEKLNLVKTNRKLLKTAE